MRVAYDLMVPVVAISVCKKKQHTHTHETVHSSIFKAYSFDFMEFKCEALHAQMLLMIRSIVVFAFLFVLVAACAFEIEREEKKTHTDTR